MAVFKWKGFELKFFRNYRSLSLYVCVCELSWATFESIKNVDTPTLI